MESLDEVDEIEGIEDTEEEQYVSPVNPPLIDPKKKSLTDKLKKFVMELLCIDSN